MRELREADLRALVQAGLAEHTHLEYKSALYENNHDGKKEFLLDVCMFANSQGGVLLIGIPEARDGAGQPTGTPDPAAQLGIEIQNPEATLLAYGSRIDECIEENLKVESHAIPVAPDRFVLALRVPSSPARPHSVRYAGHTYFPCRRERHRTDLDITEIKEMAIRVASQHERAEALLERTLTELPRRPQNLPTLSIGLVPIYFRDFGIDISRDDVSLAFGQFHLRTQNAIYVHPSYAYQGLIRQTDTDTSTLSRNGLVRSISDLGHATPAVPGSHAFHCTAIDVLLRNFVLRLSELFAALAVNGPFLLRAVLQTPGALFALRQDGAVGEHIDRGTYGFGSIQAMDVNAPFEQLIKPLCDHAHQMFGEARSPCFDAENHWQARF